MHPLMNRSKDQNTVKVERRCFKLYISCECLYTETEYVDKSQREHDEVVDNFGGNPDIKEAGIG